VRLSRVGGRAATLVAPMELTLEAALLVFPGLVGLAVYRGVRDRMKNDEAFIHAAFILGFTLFGGLVAGASLGFPATAEQLSGAHLAVSLSAVVLAGVMIATAANHEVLYKVGARLKLTKRAGEHQPWDHVFRTSKASYVRIRFKDGRVLVGSWRWASRGEECHQLFIADAVWHEEDGSHEVLGDGVLLPTMNEVLGIDFVAGTGREQI
jgi:hypothetical protein